LQCVHVFLFQSLHDPSVVAFTRDASGMNLPTKLGPWTNVPGAVLSVGGDALGIGGLSPVIAAIEERGFYIAQSMPGGFKPRGNDDSERLT
jgi:hypothetical protein